MTTNKYTNGKIYRLVNNVDDEFYIGSTIQSLHQRKAGHKLDCKRNSHIKVYQHINKIGWDNIKIILIENYPCNSIDELKARERYWIECLKPNLNQTMPSRTIQEYREEYRDSINEQNRKRYKNNIEKERQRSKIYRENNTGKDKQRHRIYYENNRDKILERNRTKTKCDCGCEVKNSSLSIHKKTKKHQEWLNNQPSASSS